MKKPFVCLMTATLMASTVPVRAAQPAMPESVGEALGTPSLSPDQHATSPADEIVNLWNAGEKKKARKLLSDWKKKTPKSGLPYVVAARFEFEEGHFKKCLSLGEKALSLSPQNAEAYYWRGRAYEALKNSMDAANEYRAAMLLNPDDNAAESALARTQTQLAPSESSQK